MENVSRGIPVLSLREAAGDAANQKAVENLWVAALLAVARNDSKNLRN